MLVAFSATISLDAPWHNMPQTSPSEQHIAPHTLSPCGPMETHEMRTADHASNPRSSHTIKSVDISSPVNRHLHFGTGNVTDSHCAMTPVDLDQSDGAFRVVLNGRSVVVAAVPAPPTIPHPFISTTLRDGVWVPTTEYMQ